MFTVKDTNVGLNDRNTEGTQGGNMDGISLNEVNQRHLNVKQLYCSSDVMFVDECSDGATTTDNRSKSPVESLNTIDVLMGGGATLEPLGGQKSTTESPSVHSTLSPIADNKENQT